MHSIGSEHTNYVRGTSWRKKDRHNRGYSDREMNDGMKTPSKAKQMQWMQLPDKEKNNFAISRIFWVELTD